MERSAQGSRSGDEQDRPAKGQLRFDADAYAKAIAEFLADCESRGTAATYKAYTEYAAEHKGEVPSAAAVRKFYGSWNSALAAVG